jgi:cobalt transporter subunit CbtA
MLQRLLLTGLLSGAVAGVVLTLVHLTIVQPLIAEAEFYEEQASVKENMALAGVQHVHTGGVSHTHTGGKVPHLHEQNFHIHAEGQVAGTAHVHSDAKPGHTHTSQSVQADHDHGAHSHGENSWAPQDGLERSFYTLAANMLTAISFGLLLAAGFTLYGGSISLSQGALWGGAGFLSFSFLPGLGLPAELPASAAGELLARQGWWLGTAAASVIGLAVIAFVKSNTWRVAGILLLILPYAIGAPHPEAGAIGASPPELAAHFVMVTLLASALMWGALGVAASYVYGRLTQDQSATIAEPHRT